MGNIFRVESSELLKNASIKIIPKTFLIHFGTNDLDHTSKQAMSAKFLQFTSYLCKRFPLEDINFNIARKILDLPNAHFVPHHNLFLTNTEEILKKHLNEQGFKIFLKNLKDCLLGRNSLETLARLLLFNTSFMVQDKPEIAQENINNLKILQHQDKELGKTKCHNQL